MTEQNPVADSTAKVKIRTDMQLRQSSQLTLTLVAASSITIGGTSCDQLNDHGLPSEDETSAQAIPDDDETPALVATIALSVEGSELRIIDHTPNLETPSISIVVIEPDGPSVAAELMRENASPLEIFLALAPNEDPPETLVREHLATYETRGLSPVPRVLNPVADPVPASDLVDNPRPSAACPNGSYPTCNPSAQQDTWGVSGGQGCQSVSGYQSAFHSWHSGMGGYDNHAEPAGYTSADAWEDTYWNFGSNDEIWVGVCNSYFLSSNVMPVAMQSSFSGTWITAPLTQATLSNGWRYLYHNYTGSALPRRLKVAGSAASGRFALSGAWDE